MIGGVIVHRRSTERTFSPLDAPLRRIQRKCAVYHAGDREAVRMAHSAAQRKYRK